MLLLLLLLLCKLGASLTMPAACSTLCLLPPPLLLLLLLQYAAGCVLNNDQRVTCTWNEEVGPGDEKVEQLTAIASKAGTYVNKATVFTTKPGVANQTATANVVVEDVSTVEL
jgi:hypothetical protein